MALWFFELPPVAWLSGSSRDALWVRGGPVKKVEWLDQDGEGSGVRWKFLGILAY